MKKDSREDKNVFLNEKLSWERPNIQEMKLADSEGGGTKKFTSTENPGGQYQPQVNPS